MTRWTSTLTLGGCKKTTKRHSTRKRINLGQKGVSPAQNWSKSVRLGGAPTHISRREQPKQSCPKTLCKGASHWRVKGGARVSRAVIGRYEFSPRGFKCLIWSSRGRRRRVDSPFFFLFGSLGFRNVLSLGLRGYSPFYIVDALMVSL